MYHSSHPTGIQAFSRESGGAERSALLRWEWQVAFPDLRRYEFPHEKLAVVKKQMDAA
jgi:hypothetical protein